METILAILYSIVGYWAVNRTIYAHYVMVGYIGSIILRKWTQRDSRWPRCPKSCSTGRIPTSSTWQTRKTPCTR